MAIKIGIAGVTGRMGQLLVEEVRAAGAELVGGASRGKVAPAGVAVFPNIAALADASDVVIDFTNAATAQTYAAAMAQSGKAWVLGTSGPVGRRRSSRGGRGADASLWSTHPTSPPA